MVSARPADLAIAGTASITVSNPEPGGGLSNARDFTITGPLLSIRSIVNAASMLGGPVAPEEIVTLFGSGLGPPALTRNQVSAGGLLETSLAGTRSSSTVSWRR